MILPKQQQDYDALVAYLRQTGGGACLNALVEDGPDNMTDFAGLLRDFKARDGDKGLNDFLREFNQ